MQWIITWNVDWWQRTSPQSERVPVVTGRHDAAWLLQEIKLSTFRSVMERWAGQGLSVSDVHEPARPSWMACALLLPTGFRMLDAGFVVELPCPQRGMWVEAEHRD